MQVTVTGRHFEITDALRQHIDTKVRKLERYIDANTEVHIVLSVEKHRHLAEINFQANGTPIRALEETHDMYQSFDTAIEKIERQVKRQKEKEVDRKERAGRKSSEIIVQEPFDETVFETQPRVIHTKKFAIKPMSVDEAAMQMGLVEDDFLVFLNSTSDQINVMYKRKDGNYGLIEPEF